MSPYVPLAFFPFLWLWMVCVSFQGKTFNIVIVNLWWNHLNSITRGTYFIIYYMDIRCILKRVDISLIFTDGFLKRAWIMKRIWVLGLRLLKVRKYIPLFWCFLSTIVVWHLTEIFTIIISNQSINQKWNLHEKNNIKLVIHLASQDTCKRYISFKKSILLNKTNNTYLKRNHFSIQQVIFILYIIIGSK